MTLKVTDGEQDGWAVLRVSGEMDLVTSPVLRQRVHDAVADGRHSLVLDLSEVLFCDSSGVGVLIATRRLIRSCQGRLRLILPAQGAADALPRQPGPRRPGCAPALRRVRRRHRRRSTTTGRPAVGVIRA